MTKLRLPGGLELALNEPTTIGGESDEEKRVTTARQKHLEIYAATFLRQVGSEKAAEYELIEEWGKDTIHWYFRRRGPDLSRFEILP
ncbi:MAG TPA: hypothetical protein DCS07_00785 [Bdellovibrionales bacterium]|nr:MAG: hypothetical protein A2Z97_04145 [Bdellovibrionales bacterium GWB1_52_6]OFZ02426.1 MAG: hypothetical protein A2X97_12820 [Bdellovibrionales bacterium GWA1_52_35]OFZ34356.1 MAG: hypothetical protein A2070_03055 [Bdellovibrionales bacterium GWC1_52_8]HAR41165.1 hypothetical protein [Bdellovibrionales bacterium]HCM41545.1 hypothetical protein [Bdellovibrionales bacterium]